MYERMVSIKKKSEIITVLNVLLYVIISLNRDLKNTWLFWLALSISLFCFVLYAVNFKVMLEHKEIKKFTLIYQPIFILFFMFYIVYKMGFI